MHHCFLFHQGARCGEGVRFRNLSCFVSDGSDQTDGSLVDDEMCGDLEPSLDGDEQIILQEACTVPCPGRSSRTETRQNQRSRSHDEENQS